jgi:glucose-6-phosphate 1-epimerase
VKEASFSYDLGRDGEQVLVLSAGGAEARVALRGAHVLSFRPAGHEDLLWRAPASRFGVDSYFHGGIPLCWPWFALHEEAGMPLHGFVRSMPWSVTEVDADSNVSMVVLGCEPTDSTRALWPHSFELRCTISLGQSLLSVDLDVLNTDTASWTFQGALHTYLRVGAVDQARILGLDGVDYLDKTDSHARRTQRGALSIAGETDSIYLDTSGSIEVDDPVLERRIRVTRRGSRTAVVWNPGPGAAGCCEGFEPGSEAGMVCVESAIAGPDVICLEPGQGHALGTSLSVE